MIVSNQQQLRSRVDVGRTAIMARASKTLHPTTPTPRQALAATTATRLVELRDKAGLNNAQLSKKSGIDTSTISRLLSGQRPPTTQQIGELAQALGCSADDILKPGELTEGSAPAAPASDLMPGLAAYFERHASDHKITNRERYHLENSRFSTEPWVVFDDKFWSEVLKFWRARLAEEDARTDRAGPAK